MSQFTDHNHECNDPGHNNHLCYIVAQGFHMSEKDKYLQLVNRPHFKCEHCGRVANEAKNLCQPIDMKNK